MTNESEAMEVWFKAFDAYEDCAVQSFGANDQAAARVIATALAARGARIAELEGALTDAAANGLIYWEPITARGITAKAAMLDRIDAILTNRITS